MQRKERFRVSEMANMHGRSCADHLRTFQRQVESRLPNLDDGKSNRSGNLVLPTSHTDEPPLPSLQRMGHVSHLCCDQGITGVS